MSEQTVAAQIAVCQVEALHERPQTRGLRGPDVNGACLGIHTVDVGLKVCSGETQCSERLKASAFLGVSFQKRTDDPLPPSQKVRLGPPSLHK